MEGLILNLQYFGHLMQRTDSLENTPMLVKIGGRRRRGQQMMRWLDGITDSMDMSLHKVPAIVKDGEPGALQSMASQTQTQLSNWTAIRGLVQFKPMLFKGQL